MNIFVTDSNPVIAAQNLDDKRVIKMILESAQMLSTAINEHGGTGPYRTTHKNHPCNIWARATRSNYKWLFEHFEALCAEYTSRYGKTHKCSQIGSELFKMAYLIPDGPLTDFANCAAHSGFGLSYKHLSDVTMAYKLYLKDRFGTDKRKPTWYGNCNAPF